MATDFWARYAQGGAAARPDSFTGLADPFSQALMAMLQNAPEDVQIGITSAYRSPETQQRLWEEALAKYGSESEARKWVAPPGKSQHNHGHAADLKYLSPAAQEWVHQNAGQYGLAFPLSNEPWHVELATARGQGGQAPSPAAPAPAGNALAPANSLTALSAPTGAQPNALSRIPFMAPPEVTFEPLTLPARRRA